MWRRFWRWCRAYDPKQKMTNGTILITFVGGVLLWWIIPITIAYLFSLQ